MPQGFGRLIAVLPNLIVIGAERCGTTSLHRYLGAHPEIFMAKSKELDFFVTELSWRKGRGWYEKQFRNGSRVRGESSPSYTAYPVHEGVAERMAALVPDAKLVYLVRDPIERTLSGYHHQRALALENRPLADALSDVEREPTHLAQPVRGTARALPRALPAGADPRRRQP